MNERDILEAWEHFCRTTQASNEDCLKALSKIKSGTPVNKVIEAWRKKEHKSGRLEAHEDFVDVFTMEDCYDDMEYDLLNGKEKGTTTYIEGLDNAWTWRRSEFNIWTGYSNEGKSLFIRFLCLIKAVMEGKKFAFYAPEDYPAKEFFDDLIHTAAGYSTDKDNPNFIGKEMYREMYNKLKEAFYFVYIRPPKNSLVNVMKAFIPLIEEKGVDACIIDPIIKVSRPKAYMNADDKYAAYVTTLATDFSRKFNISLNLVMHQLTPRLQENGLYPKPSMYNIKGGGTWTDGTDNINSIWRPAYARDKGDDEVMFTSHKIKKQKLVGIPQDVKFRFNRKTNRYVSFETKAEVFDFDQHLKVPRLKLLFT
jgi:twinkle protein